MLRRLDIEQYGLVARATIELAAGNTVFTGETGSGKTMLVGALGFVLGARAGGDIVRRGAARASVTLAFEATGPLRLRLVADGYPIDEGEEATILREMTDAGKSSVRLNGRPTTAAYIRENAPLLAEVVGQREAQRLLSPAYHLELLDRFGGERSVRAREVMEKAFEEHARCQQALAELQSDEQRLAQRYQEARETIEEIDAVSVVVGEEGALEQRQRVLTNVERISAALRSAHAALSDDEGAASERLGSARSALRGICEISAELREVYERAAALQDDVTELSTRLARTLDSIEFDAGELEALNARLDQLDRLKRKYGATLQAVLDRAAAARAITEGYESRAQRAHELQSALGAAERDLRAAAQALSAIRNTSAAALAAEVTAELKALAFATARFEASLTPHGAIGALGAENAEFSFSANNGEPLRPLARVASGGELSRVLLALVVVLANARGPSALVFDEIDAGIGGATAAAVASRLARLAQHTQVMTITHLAQLATSAQRHYVLEKAEVGGATTISVREAQSESERTAELARMLSGEPHEAALQHARALLRHASSP
jgi:DNA repair protein RecN (Recombination protein N)